MGKYRPGKTKKRKKDAEQHVLRDSSKGTHYINNARDKNNGPTARRTKQEGEGGRRRVKGGRRKEKGKREKQENRKQKTENRKAERIDYKECTQRGFCLQFIIFLGYFRTFFYFYLVVCLFFATFALRNNKT